MNLDPSESIRETNSHRVLYKRFTYLDLNVSQINPLSNLDYFGLQALINLLPGIILLKSSRKASLLK